MSTEALTDPAEFLLDRLVQRRKEAQTESDFAELAAQHAVILEHSRYTGIKQGTKEFCKSCVRYPIGMYMGVHYPCPTLWAYLTLYGWAPE